MKQRNCSTSCIRYIHYHAHTYIRTLIYTVLSYYTLSVCIILYVVTRLNTACIYLFGCGPGCNTALHQAVCIHHKQLLFSLTSNTIAALIHSLVGSGAPLHCPILLYMIMCMNELLSLHNLEPMESCSPVYRPNSER